MIACPICYYFEVHLKYTFQFSLLYILYNPKIETRSYEENEDEMFFRDLHETIYFQDVFCDIYSYLCAMEYKSENVN